MQLRRGERALRRTCRLRRGYGDGERLGTGRRGSRDDEPFTRGAQQHQHQRDACDNCRAHAAVRHLFADADRAFHRRVLQHRKPERAAENWNRAEIAFQEARKRVAQRPFVALRNGERKLVAFAAEQSKEFRTVRGAQAGRGIANQRAHALAGQRMNVPLNGLREIEWVGQGQKPVYTRDGHGAFLPGPPGAPSRPTRRLTGNAPAESKPSLMATIARLNRRRILLHGALSGIAGGVVLAVFWYLAGIVPAHGDATGMGQYVASAAFGKAAFGSASYAWIGLGLHALVSIAWGIGYVYMTETQRNIAANPAASGLIFGLVVWVVMQMVLASVQMLTVTGPNVGIGILGHTVFFGLPVALAARAQARGIA